MQEHPKKRVAHPVVSRKRFWFWVWLVQATVAKEDLHDEHARCEVWLNLKIVNADDEKEAYAKALALGKAEAGDCRGTLRFNGRPAIAQFLGVQAMGVIHDDLEDGAEITFESRRCSQAKAHALVASKTNLLREVGEELRQNLPYLGKQ